MGDRSKGVANTLLHAKKGNIQKKQSCNKPMYVCLQNLQHLLIKYIKCWEMYLYYSQISVML
jgi:hypothetical protein